VPLLRSFQLLFGDFQFSARRILRDDLGEKLAKSRRGGHMTVNVDDFCPLCIKDSF